MAVVGPAARGRPAGYGSVASCGDSLANGAADASAQFNVAMRAVVSCEGCGHRQEVARDILAPSTFHIICHRCEQSLVVTVTEADLRTAASMRRSRTPIS